VGALLIGLPLLLSLYRAWNTVTAATHQTRHLAGGVSLPPRGTKPGGTSTNTLIRKYRALKAR